MNFPSSSLIVIEGADGTGKTTVVSELILRFKTVGINAVHLAFPGKAPSTLGELVYRLHHDSNSVGVHSITPSALQALHVAAHLDAVEKIIKPNLRAGSTVILDRFWWSTIVYGRLEGVKYDILAALVQAERLAWDAFEPTCAFLLTRKTSLKTDILENWQEITTGYFDLIKQEIFNYPVKAVNNDGSIQQTVDQIWRALVNNRVN